MKQAAKKIKKLKLNFHFFSQLPAREKKITFSTFLTLMRIAAVPFIVATMWYGWWGVACILFIAACLSDMLDGYAARYFNQRTFLGACLDPIADKILILSVFSTLAFVHTPLFAIPAWFVWVILCKELILVGGALCVYLVNGHLEIRPRLLGKVTTVAQMGFIIWLFACYFFQWVPNKTYITMLGILLILTCTSLIHYILIGVYWLEGTE